MIQWYMMFNAAGSIPCITHNPTREKRDKERMRNEKEKERYEIQSILYLN